MAASAVAATKVAIVYASQGGMGDVGKFAAVHALRHATIQPTIVAVSVPGEERAGSAFSVDVADAASQEDVRATLSGAAIHEIDIESPDAEAGLAAALEGVDAVVACVGNRQGERAGKLFGMEGFSTRWCAVGATKVVSAMHTKGIGRLVILSSFGIGNDLTPRSVLKTFWGCLLGTLLRSVKQDLVAMEDVVARSPEDIDFALIRAVGLAPEEPAIGTTKVLRKRGDGDLALTVSKSDVAHFMLDEAMSASVHRAAATVGKAP